MRCVRWVLMTVVACLAASTLSLGQFMGKQTGCYPDKITANPNRPTVANPADITQYGILEIEYGWNRLWPDQDIQQSRAEGLLKFGLLCDIELRWDTTSFLSQTDATGTHRTFGDNWIGPQVRFYLQTARVPSLAFSYAVKIPSASTEDGLGSGRVDHAFTFLASKDIGKFHSDFNFSELLVGRPGASGFDSNQQVNLTLSHVIRGGLQLQGELYGDTQLNQATPGFASSLWALTYTITPRLVVDGGFEKGLTSGGPHRHAFAGVTYSITDVYSHLPHRQQSHQADH